MVAAVLAVFNIFSGLALVDRELNQSEPHLIRAIALLVVSITGHLMILRADQRAREEAALQNRSMQKSELLQTLTFGNLILAVVALITGTIANPGSFPWLHGLLGYGLVTLLVLSSLSWLIRGLRA